MTSTDHAPRPSPARDLTDLVGISAVLADPDRSGGRRLATALTARNVDVEVVQCTDGAEALLQIGRTTPDLVVVAADLPGVDVGTLSRVVRAAFPDLPIAVGVGVGEAEAAGRALAVTGTMCVSRPYRLRELVPLVHDRRIALAGRSHRTRTLAVGGILLDPVGYSVHVHGLPLQLPLREFELLRFLMLNADRVVSRDDIITHVWGDADPGSARSTLSVHVSRLRCRLGDDAADPRIIRTHRGLGYRLTSPSS